MRTRDSLLLGLFFTLLLCFVVVATVFFLIEDPVSRTTEPSSQPDLKYIYFSKTTAPAAEPLTPPVSSVENVLGSSERHGFGWSPRQGRSSSQPSEDDDANAGDETGDNDQGEGEDNEDSDSEDQGQDEEGDSGNEGDDSGDGDQEDDTPPTELLTTPENFKVAFIGDSGYGDNYADVLRLIRDENADLVLHQGDLGYNEGNPEAPQRWLDNIQTILDPISATETFPYFYSIGNHDVSRWEVDNGYRDILQERFANLDVEYTGNPEQVGVQTSFIYNGVHIVFTAPGIDADFIPENHEEFIEEQFQDSPALWTICSWHKNMRAMQAGGKGDETGWGVYEECREQGAIIATGHEHSYSRTFVLSDMSEQIIADNVGPLLIQPGETFAFVSGLGGASIRDQGIFADYFASVYTSDQDANYGALFIEFNVDGDPRKARGYFKDIDGRIADEFELYNNKANPGDEEETPPEPSPGEFVSVSGTSLQLEGEAYQFIGFNVYGLANDEDIFACGPSANHGENPNLYLDHLFSTLSEQGVNAIRFWAFQGFTDGGTDFSAMDRVIDYAERYNVKLIPVLENHWDDCTEGGEKSSSWYQEGYLLPYGDYAISYREYVERIVTHYEDEPTILMWQIMNEAESDDADALYDFAVDISGLIQTLDENHIVSLGTIGRGQAGTAGEDFVRLHSIPTIDVVEAHDYNSPLVAWPSSGSNSINRAFDVAQELNKPFFIGESGISVGDEISAEERAALFDAKIAAAFEREVAGYLIWQWDNSEENYGSGCNGGYCVTEGDPVLDVVLEHSS